MEKPFPNVQVSLGKCLQNEAFLDRFYEVFMTSHPSIRPKFSNTEFAKQKTLLRQGLTMALMMANGSEAATSTIKHLALTHDHEHLNINPSLYAFWTNSLVQAVSEFDPNFDAALEAEWRKAIQVAVDCFKSAYWGG